MAGFIKNLGPAGAPGSVWREGTGVPDNSSGIDGDYYFRTTTNAIYYRQSAAYSIIGYSGSRIWTGSGTPAQAGVTGADSDFYVDNSGTGNLYYKSGGVWAVTANVLGSQWHTGTGVPSDSLGVNGDMYLDTAAWNVYQKLIGTYGAALCNIKGGTGATGPTGNAASGEVFYVPGTMSASSYAGYSFRQASPANIFGFNGSKVRITLAAPTVQNLWIDHVGICQQSSTYVGTGAIPEVTFNNGGHGVTLAFMPNLPGTYYNFGVAVSDWITFTWTASAGQLIIFDIHSSGTQKLPYRGSMTGYTDYYLAATASYSTLSPGGGWSSLTTELDFLYSIEIAP